MKLLLMAALLFGIKGASRDLGPEKPYIRGPKFINILQDSFDSYYKFKNGTSWTYDHVFPHQGHSHKAETTMVVTNVDDRISMRINYYDGSIRDLQFYNDDGYLTWAVVDAEGKVHPTYRIVKKGAKKGDKWDPNATGSEDLVPHGKLSAEHMGVVDVKVPSGEYKANHTQILWTADDAKVMTVDYYFVAKVGLVKWEVTMLAHGLNRKTTWGLKSFKQGE